MTERKLSWIMASILLVSGCGHSADTMAPENSVVAEVVPVDVSGERALEEVQQFVALGPRLSDHMVARAQIKAPDLGD